MLTLLVEVILGVFILGVFISNFKASEHPYISNFIKGFLIGGSGYIIGNILDFYENKSIMDFNEQIVLFLITQGVGLVYSFFLSLFTFFSNDE